MENWCILLLSSGESHDENEFLKVRIRADTGGMDEHSGLIAFDYRWNGYKTSNLN